MTDKQFLQQAIALARRNIEKGGRPFGAVIVKDGKIISEGVNQMAELNDPTAHAELLALRHAGQTRLEGCVVYASGQPCPMCLAAMRMAGMTRAVYAYSNSNSNSDAQPYGLSTEVIAVALRTDPHEQTGFSFTQQKPDDEPSLYAQWQAHQH